ncbi:MAG: hypothetical protein HDT42_03210 [Ruminococcaceae bacterium]|nr:hypothetical protein [Oscillospiraceae bacterium]
MAKVNFIGLQNLDFETRDGNQIQGLKLHITFPDENVMGLMADSKFISRDACKNLGLSVDSLSPMIGKEIEIETNIKGKVTGVKPVGKSN